MDARTDTPLPAAAPPPPPGRSRGRAAPAAAAARGGSRRRQLFLLLGAVVAIGAIVWGVDWVLVGSHHVSTDDAYVNADVADVTPLVSGPIIAAPGHRHACR